MPTRRRARACAASAAAVIRFGGSATGIAALCLCACLRVIGAAQGVVTISGLCVLAGGGFINTLWWLARRLALGGVGFARAIGVIGAYAPILQGLRGAFTVGIALGSGVVGRVPTISLTVGGLVVAVELLARGFSAAVRRVASMGGIVVPVGVTVVDVEPFIDVDIVVFVDIDIHALMAPIKAAPQAIANANANTPSNAHRHRA